MNESPTNPLWAAMSVDRETPYDPTFAESPHPRHRARRVHDSWWITGTQYQHDYEFHLVDDDDTAAHHYDTAAHHDNDPAGTRHPAAAASSSSNRLPAGDRRPHRETLVPVRTGRSAMGDRDRLARVELPTRRSEPHWLLFDLSDGAPVARSHVRRGRLSGLVSGPLQCGSEHPGRRAALCGLGILTLATLTWAVL